LFPITQTLPAIVTAIIVLAGAQSSAAQTSEVWRCEGDSGFFLGAGVTLTSRPFSSAEKELILDLEFQPDGLGTFKTDGLPEIRAYYDVWSGLYRVWEWYSDKNEYHLFMVFPNGNATFTRGIIYLTTKSFLFFCQRESIVWTSFLH